jgi:hemerythrin superfamily protein
MDVVDLIKADHNAIAALIDKIKQIAEDPATDASELMEDLYAEIYIHFRAVEKSLYRACRRSRKDLRNLALKGRMEHRLIELLIKHLLRKQPDSEGRFLASAMVLEELFDHHASQANTEVLPQVTQAFTAEEREQMSGRMQFLKEKFRDELVKERKTSGPAGIRRKEMGNVPTHR